MKVETINIPETVKDMRIDRLPFLLKVRDIENPDRIKPETICALNSEYTGIPIKKMESFSLADNKTLFKEILRTFGTYEPEAVPLSLEYGGQVYTLKDDFSKLPVVWFLDVENADFMEDPIDLVSYCYIEEGKNYGETDKHQNITNPIKERSEVFKEHLPLSTYLDIQGFFLNSWETLQRLSPEVRSLAKERELKEILSSGESQ